MRPALVLLALGLACPAPAIEPTAAQSGNAAKRPGKPRAIEWMELLPENERRNAPGSGEAQHDYLGEDGPEAKQQGSAAINPALNNTFVRIPGFIVPLTLRQEKIVTEFLLVPYFGACIHVPPPPPNQIVYVKLDKATPIKTIWEPYWITGTLTTTVKDTRTASTAYTLSGISIEPYQ
ncbi:MAG: DUF3299 domain-containing protein [Steroidobacteraceae bacterium]